MVPVLIGDALVWSHHVDGIPHSALTKGAAPIPHCPMQSSLEQVPVVSGLLVWNDSFSRCFFPRPQRKLLLPYFASLQAIPGTSPVPSLAASYQLKSRQPSHPFCLTQASFSIRLLSDCMPRGQQQKGHGCPEWTATWAPNWSKQILT